MEMLILFAIAVITILLAEVLRISFGTRAVGWDNLVYGVLLVLFIVFLPAAVVSALPSLLLLLVILGAFRIMTRALFK